MKSHAKSEVLPARRLGDEGPRTLESMGVPTSLARELEQAFALMGGTRGDRVVGWTFRTPDGQEHQIRTTQAAAQLDRAA